MFVYRGGKNRRALRAGNVKQLQEIRFNEDFQWFLSGGTANFKEQLLFVIELHLT